MWIWWAGLAVAGELDAGQVADVAKTAELTVAEVEAHLDGVERDDTVLKRMATPWEAKPWHQYRGIFLTDKRIDAGRTFLEENQALFERAEKETGVPKPVILAILGVETSYGTRMGDDSVLRALYTLGFFHERRGAFFRKELGHFLRLSTDQGWKASEPKGSYAGAMGMGQFMPSSYRTWAVDFDGDGGIDLFESRADAVGSVANYFVDHGWVPGGPVLVAATGEGLEAHVSKGLKPNTTVGALRARGVTIDSLEDDEAVRLLEFEGVDGPEYAVGAKNFYVITRYNHSPLYARAVWELSEAYSAVDEGAAEASP